MNELDFSDAYFRYSFLIASKPVAFPHFKEFIASFTFSIVKFIVEP
jgi:hypothetical protein